MAFTKYAKAEVLDLSWSDTQGSDFSKHARHVQSDYDKYRTDQGYLYCRIRAISSRLNKNFDSWPSVELAGSQDIFDRHQSSADEGLADEGFIVEAKKNEEFGFSTFLGKPVFVDHNNSNPQRARGVVVDARLHVEPHKTAALDPFYSSHEAEDYHSPPTWVELLLEVDAKTFPKFAQALLDGGKDSSKGIDGFSMGANVTHTDCNICDKRARSSDEFCSHIRIGKGNKYTVTKNGKTFQKKAAEKCCGIQFFELSGVFDPADETALVKEVKSAMTHTADSVPQSELERVPEHVDTLRKERTCEVCGSDMDGTKCSVCGWSPPPEGFKTPDLEKAHQNIMERQDDGLPGGLSDEANNPPTLASLRNDMGWNLSLHPKVAGKINKIERPIVNPAKPQTNEPTKETIIRDVTKPRLSSLTAKDFIAAVQNESSGEQMRTANDEAANVDPNEKTVEVVAVGGVDEASNEAASKADGQVDVQAKGGTGVESVSADQENVNVEQGNETSKNIEAIPTQTWHALKGDGDSLGQQDPVTTQAFASTKEAYDEGAGDLISPELSGGSAQQGNQPIDPVGKADDRVDVLKATTSPANNSGPTKTWTGTDGNGVNKQQDPVTNDVYPSEGGVTSSHIFTAFKLADLEVEMGLLDSTRKYERIAELEGASHETVEASLKYAQRVKQAGFGRQAKVARRVPQMGRSASVDESPVDVRDVDSALFM